jgi:hypothetical protein
VSKLVAVVPYLKMLKKTNKLPIFIDLDTLDLYCEYLLNYMNRTITFSNLSNLEHYVSQMDENNFKQNEAKMARYLFLKYFLEARLKKGITSAKLIFKYIEDRVSKKYWAIINRDIINGLPHNQMGTSDVKFVNDMIYSKLNTIFMHSYKDAMLKMIEDLNSDEFGKDVEDCDNAINFFQSMLNELTKAQRKARNDNRFNLTDEDNFNTIMQEAAERALSDNHFLQTGWQGLNKMLNGGFEDARVYNFIGATGGFKSGLLLNLMKQIKLYNKMRPHKDPTKRPTILFISQENNIWETFLRIYGIFGGTGKIKDHNIKEIFAILKKGGFCVVEDDLDIDIEFRYYGNMDINVADIRGMVQELDASDREVIVIIQDYIERLRPPVIANSEKRNQLADVSNQLHDLAVDLDIPIITASQFNRAGVTALEEAKEKNQKDISKKVGTGNISESYGMLKNIDVNISIVVEYDLNEERYYLSFRALKFRGDDTNALKYFLQPFVGKNSKIQLMDDIGTQPVYRLTMADEIRANASDITELTLGKIDLGMNASDSLIDNETYEMKQTEYFINNLKPKTTALPDIRYDETEDWFLHPRDKNGFMHLSWKHDSPDINSIKISGGKIKIS